MSLSSAQLLDFYKQAHSLPPMTRADLHAVGSIQDLKMSSALSMPRLSGEGSNGSPRSDYQQAYHPGQSSESAQWMEQAEKAQESYDEGRNVYQQGAAAMSGMQTVTKRFQPAARVNIFNGRVDAAADS